MRMRPRRCSDEELGDLGPQSVLRSRASVGIGSGMTTQRVVANLGALSDVNAESIRTALRRAET